MSKLALGRWAPSGSCVHIRQSTPACVTTITCTPVNIAICILATALRSRGNYWRHLGFLNPRSHLLRVSKCFRKWTVIKATAFLYTRSHLYKGIWYVGTVALACSKCNFAWTADFTLCFKFQSVIVAFCKRGLIHNYLSTQILTFHNAKTIKCDKSYWYFSFDTIQSLINHLRPTCLHKITYPMQGWGGVNNFCGHDKC